MMWSEAILMVTKNVNFFKKCRQSEVKEFFKDLVKEDSFSTKRWRKVQFLADHYWKKWIREYLPTLRKSSKWVKLRGNV